MPHDDATVDHAIEVATSTPLIPLIVDDVHPWYATLKWPLTIIAAALLAVAGSTVLLAVALVRATDEDIIRKQQVECREEYTANITATGRASDIARDALIIALSEEGRPGVPEAIVNLTEANRLDAEALAARDAYDEAGRPLPCTAPNASTSENP